MLDVKLVLVLAKNTVLILLLSFVIVVIALGDTLLIQSLFTDNHLIITKQTP
jgi:hypothetical protein